MHGPTHRFCPNCSAILPPQLETCPRCEEDLKNPSAGITGRDIFQLTGVILLVAVLPFVILIGVAVVCVLSTR
jgi:hypothetical protein